ncbi:hypothetical protein [Porphyrobacter sp. AAP82]|uniref:hypothetical protein n=1 Tax=Porphyrobacter sp. AAP82 TaxID=1248917 RepID=UPI00031B1AAC|nr:hypothetical protein [Porphyrobacter sp. AAP82]
MKAGLPLLALTLVLAACAPAAKAPPVATAARPAPRPALVAAPARPAPLPAPVDMQWMDAPLTPGSWSYEGRGNLTLAVFSGQAVFAMHCWRPRGELSFVLGGETGSVATIRTETAARALPLQHSGAEIPTSATILNARDPLLDAMALSKGRFAVEVDGTAPLILPSHAEVSRVIEDCRG